MESEEEEFLYSCCARSVTSAWKMIDDAFKIHATAVTE